MEKGKEMELSEKGMKLLMEYRAARKKWLTLAGSKGCNLNELSAARESTEAALTDFGIRCSIEYELSEGEKG